MITNVLAIWDEVEYNQAVSRRTWYPTNEPLLPGGGSHRSTATLSATEIA